MRGAVGRALDAVRTYPAMVGSVSIILILIGITIYAVISIPLSEAIALWDATHEAWIDAPRSAAPAWTNLFRSEKLPETQILRLADGEKSEGKASESVRYDETVLRFDYRFTSFPDEARIFLDVAYGQQAPIVAVTWIKPDGTEIRLFRGNPDRSHRIRISRRAEVLAAFGIPDQAGPSANPAVMQGEYKLRIESQSFEEAFSIDGRLVVAGKVYGLAGTDNEGRDLMIGLLWGTPIALAFGLLATIGTTIFGFILAAIGTWFGGWADASVQRLTEVGMMLPMLPILIMVGKFFSSSIWVLLGFIVGLGIFTGAVKSYRAMFLQVKDSLYIEAARAYGASDMRIIFRYMIPKIIPALVPSFVMGIPRFVFLEASFAVLGIADPRLPTWGKVLSDGRAGLYLGHYHGVLEPAFLLILTGLSFTMLGYVLDRTFNTGLRSV
ncbi:ABC transporter permease [Candidatus Bipolaricaulota bacterium]